jgi:hypothetical protein
MDEVVFRHRPSRTVILADLVETFSDQFLRKHWSWWQRPLAALDGIVARKALEPLEWRLSFLDRAPARAARAKTCWVGTANGSSWRTGSGSVQTVTLTWSGRWPGLARKGEGDRRPSYAGGGPNTSTALRPPNAKEFDMA